MTGYQVHRIKEAQRNQFRWAPHSSGVTEVKPKDYELGITVEAATPYEVWSLLRSGPEPLVVGDVLESEGGRLTIYKYVGFEPARWQVPEQAAGQAAGLS